MRNRNEAHLHFIRQLPCCICLDNTATEACHIRFADARIAKPITGIGIKPDDKYVVPMCGRHHREQHAGDERAFWHDHGLDPVLLSLELFSISGNVEQAESIIRKVRHLL